MLKLESVKIGHIYREANECANLLARHGKFLKRENMVSHEASGWLVSTLVKDKSETFVARVVPL